MDGSNTRMTQKGTAGSRGQRLGGFAALYLAFAYIVAMPYFLLFVDYEGATTPAQKVAVVLANYGSMYTMYLITYVVFGLVLGGLALALYDRLQDAAPVGARFATGVGLLWAIALTLSGLVFNYLMTTVVSLAEGNPGAAAVAWQAIEPVAMALGGAGGELLGGLWVLLVCTVALRARSLPQALAWFGVVIGAAGLLSVVPMLREAGYVFGLLQIAWFIWLGVVLVRSRRTEVGGAAVPAAGGLPTTRPRQASATLRAGTPSPDL